MNYQCGICERVLSAESFCPSMRRNRGWCRKCFAEYHRGRYDVPWTDDPRPCVQCGAEYAPHTRRPSVYCSRACKDSARQEHLAAEREAAKPERQCLHCGSAMSKSMRRDAKFCSEECNSKAHSLQRKLRMRTGQDDKPGYIRAAICNRDKWTCGICNRPVDRTLQHPDPMCASLDHIIPVAHGGTSDPANLRLTHLVCNLRRGDRGGLEQLALA